MSNIDIDFYCRTYDDFLEPEFCDEYISLYEHTLKYDTEKWKNLSVCFKDDGNKEERCGGCNCDRLGPMEYERFGKLNDILISKWQNAVEKYVKDCGINSIQLPKDFGWEELRIKRYKVDDEVGHGLDFHVDIYSHAHSKRFLCLMVYLNEDFEEGETHFPLFYIKVKPKKGRLFIFPPTWNYLHRGIPPRSPSKTGAKYFIMTHLNYIDLSIVNEGTKFTDRIDAAYDPNTEKMTKEQLLWPQT